MFMRKLRILFILILLLTGTQMLAAQGRDVLVLEVEGPVTPAMANYFERGIEAGETQGAEAVLIILNTPGGEVGITHEIVQIFRNSPVPVIVYIYPSGAQAASAGSVITLAAHASGMAPQTVMGATSPINSDGSDIDGTAYRKIVEDLKALMRSLTEEHSEEAIDIAELMIEEAKAVTAQEALEIGLIDAIAEDPADLLNQLDGQTVLVQGEEVVLETAASTQTPYNMNLLEILLHAVANPVIVGILMAIGIQAIIIEISNPGGWIAGLIGVLFVGLALYGLGQLPVNWLGLGLIIVAFVLFLAEVMTANNGALSLAGTLCLLGGLLLLFNTPGTPEFARISIPAALAITLGTAAFFIFIVGKALQAQKAKPYGGIEDIEREPGVARSNFTESTENNYSGTVLLLGELWQATATEPITYGDTIEVVGKDGFTLQVKKK